MTIFGKRINKYLRDDEPANIKKKMPYLTSFGKELVPSICTAKSGNHLYEARPIGDNEEVLSGSVGCFIAAEGNPGIFDRIFSQMESLKAEIISLTSRLEKSDMINQCRMAAELNNELVYAIEHAKILFMINDPQKLKDFDPFILGKLSMIRIYSAMSFANRSKKMSFIKALNLWMIPSS